MVVTDHATFRYSSEIAKSDSLLLSGTLCWMAKPKKTPKELAEDDERTNSMGLFNYAEAFWKSAVALEKAEVKAGHSASPVRTLYYHAIELYLKALLRQHYSVDKLSKKFGHNTIRMVKKAQELGLLVMDEDREVLAL